MVVRGQEEAEGQWRVRPMWLADGERGDLAAPALWARCVIVEVAEEERPLSRRRSTSVYKRGAEVEIHNMVSGGAVAVSDQGRQGT